MFRVLSIVFCLAVSPAFAEVHFVSLSAVKIQSATHPGCDCDPCLCGAKCNCGRINALDRKLSDLQAAVIAKQDGIEEALKEITAKLTSLEKPQAATVTQPKTMAATARLGYYPPSNSSRYYVMVGGRAMMPSVAHLQSGEHANQFDAAWLASLTPQMRLDLHSDHHNGVTKWDYVIKPQAKAAPRGHWVTYKRCVNGRCTFEKVWVTE